MTSIDYKKIAAVLQSTKPAPTAKLYAAHVAQWTKDVRAIVEMLHSDNPRFIEDKFLRAVNSEAESQKEAEK